MDEVRLARDRRENNICRGADSRGLRDKGKYSPDDIPSVSPLSVIGRGEIVPHPVVAEFGSIELHTSFLSLGSREQNVYQL